MLRNAQSRPDQHQADSGTDNAPRSKRWPSYLVTFSAIDILWFRSWRAEYPKRKSTISIPNAVLHDAGVGPECRDLVVILQLA